jgi:hypothetical protein
LYLKELQEKITNWICTSSSSIDVIKKKSVLHLLLTFLQGDQGDPVGGGFLRTNVRFKDSRGGRIIKGPGIPGGVKSRDLSS